MMRLLCITFLLGVCFHFAVYAELGFDLSAFVGPLDCFEDVAAEGYKFMIIEIQSSKRTFNYDIVHNTVNARKAGITDIDVYIFPDKNKPADEQTSFALNYLIQNGVEFNRFWFDVEDEPHWFPTCEENIQFLQTMLDTAAKFLPHERIGIYVENYYWSPIMCNSTQFSNYQLWWPRYDHQSSLDSFKPFGGWSMPVMKQHTPNITVSCAFFDVDWRP